MIALSDRDLRHFDSSEFFRCVVRLFLLHRFECLVKNIEAVGGGRDASIIFRQPCCHFRKDVRGESAWRDSISFHVCAKSVHPVDSFWILHCHDEADVCSVTPANEGRSVKMQRIHYSQDVALHSLIGKWMRSQRTPPVSTTIDQDNLMVGFDQSWNLISPTQTALHPSM